MQLIFYISLHNLHYANTKYFKMNFVDVYKNNFFLISRSYMCKMMRGYFRRSDTIWFP